MLDTTYENNERWTDLTSAEGRITRYHTVRGIKGVRLEWKELFFFPNLKYLLDNW